MEENQNQQNSFNNYGKMTVNTLRMPLWRQLINSFCGARKYPQFLQLPGGSVVLYFFFLVFISDGLAKFTTDIMRETVSSIGRALAQTRGCGFESRTVSLDFCFTTQ